MANIVGRAGTAAPFPTSETVGTSVADPKLGSRWFDNDNNEYIVVDCQKAFVAGEPVVIDANNLALPLDAANATANARVGVIVAAVSGSDTKAYAQIYGLYAGAAGTSNVATSKQLGVPSGTSDIGQFGAFHDSDEGAFIIRGAWAVTATDSATTSPASSFVSAGSSATPAIGFSVFLNYPYVLINVSGAILDT